MLKKKSSNSNNSKLSEDERQNWILGVLFATVGAYSIFTAKNMNDVSSGVFLILLGIGFMAVVSEDFRNKIFDYFNNIVNRKKK